MSLFKMDYFKTNPRRKINWLAARTPRGFFAVTIGTALGAGLLPLAPGTFGTLIGIPLAYFSRDWPTEFRLLLWSAIAVFGTWACKTVDELMDTKDNQNLVIDEVLGLGITAWYCGDHWLQWGAAFIAFRFFDVIKIPPVRQVDQLSKKWPNPWFAGAGVMLDDVMAGFQGLFCVELARYLGWFT